MPGRRAQARCRPKRYSWSMGSGIGKTQQRILDALGSAPWHGTLAGDEHGGMIAGPPERDGMTVMQLAERVGVSDRQVRTAVRALERRGLVVITKEQIGRSGRGEYGPLVWKGLAGTDDLPVAWVERRRNEFLERYSVEFVRAGMPRAGLLVRLR
jgi:DNA-binding transcriptional ArsR family regulator